MLLMFLFLLSTLPNDSLDLCEEGFCLCDREAIACIRNNSHFVLPNQHEIKDVNSPGLTDFTYKNTFISGILTRTEKENSTLTPITKPHYGVYPVTQTYTPDSETESAHTRPLESITAVQSALTHTWTNDSPKELENDGDNDEVLQKDKELLQTTAVTFDLTTPNTLGYPDYNTTTNLVQNTSGTESKDMKRKDKSKEMRKKDEDWESEERLHAEKTLHKNKEEAKTSQGNHVLLVSTPSATATNQTLFHPVNLIIPAQQKTEATPTSTQLSSEENRDKSREKISSKKEQISERLQATTPSKITEDQLLEIHTPDQTHTLTTTQRHLEDEEVTENENQEEKEHSEEDNLQTSAEIQASTAGHTTAPKAISMSITTTSSHLLPKHSTPDTVFRATSTLSPKTLTNMPGTHQTSHRPTTHTLLSRLLHTQTTFTKSSHTLQTSHTPLQLIHTITQKPLVTLHPLHTPPHRLPHTSKPKSTQSAPDTTTQGYSTEEEEEEEEETGEEEKNEEMKRDLVDSSQEAELKSLGVSVCDRLQCVSDHTTAECMAASRLNHTITSQCSGIRPLCMRRPHPAPQPATADSSQESLETKSDRPPHTHSKPGHIKLTGSVREQERKGAGEPVAQKDKKEEKEEEEEVEKEEEEEEEKGKEEI